MKPYEKMQAILKYHYDMRMSFITQRHPKPNNTKKFYGIPNATEEEIQSLEDEIANNDYLFVNRTNPNGVTLYRLTGEGFLFYEAGGYLQKYIPSIREKEELKIKEEGSAARLATIEQARIAKKALWISRGALILAFLAIIISIFAALPDET